MTSGPRRSGRAGERLLRASLAALAYGLPLVFIVLPVISFLTYSFFRVDGAIIIYQPTLANYVRFFADEIYVPMFVRTARLALEVALLSIVFGYPVAYLLACLHGRLKYIATLLFVVPLLMSYIIKIYAIRSILGSRGFLNRILQALGVIDQPLTVLVFNLNAVLITLAVILLPFAILPIFIALERIPRNLLEASADLGATSAQTFRRCPAAEPAGHAGRRVVHLRARDRRLRDPADGRRPAGLHVRADHLQPVRHGLQLAVRGGALGLPAARGAGSDGARRPDRPPAGARPMTLRWPLRLLLTLIALIVLLALYGPLFVAILFSFIRMQGGQILWGSFSFEAYGLLLHNQGIIEALGNTLIVGLAAVAAALILGTLFAFHYQGARGRGRELMQLMIFLPFLMPPILTGLSLLIFFRQAHIERSLVTVVIGHTLFVLALVYRILLARLQALSPSLIEASLDLGASRLQTFRYVLLPHLATAMISAALLAFALSFDETLITLLLTGTQNTLPIRLWAMMRLGFTPDINALVTLILAGTTALCLLVASTLSPARPE